MTNAADGAGVGPAALRELDRCNKCGFCLPTCPTYVQLELEPASPRGRLAIAEEVAAGRQELDGYVAEQMYLCLGCRACESACPSGVQFGVVLQDMRHLLDRAGTPAPGHAGLATLLLEHVLPQPERLRVLGRLFRFYQRSGLQAWLRRTGLLRRLSPGLANLEVSLPTAAGLPPRQAAVSAVADGARRSRAEQAAPDAGARQSRAEQAAPDVAFFRGCIMDVLYGATNDRGASVLERLGHTVLCPTDEVCCGALHAHAGRIGEARALARRNIAAFAATGARTYVNAAGGCGAFLKEYGHLLADDPVWAEPAALFSERMRDFSVAICETPGWEDRLARMATPGQHPRVTYQDSCHLCHGQRVARAPRSILRQLPGIRYAELPGADTCCGSAGLYSLTHQAMSSRVLEDKMRLVAELAPDVIVTANPGCQMQMQGGVQRAGLADRISVVHLADLVDAVLTGRGVGAG